MKILPRIIILSLFILPQTALAIVNIDQSITDVKEDGVSHTAHLSFDGASGNSEKSSIGAGLLSQWRHGDSTEFLLLKHAYGKSSGVVNTDRTFAHLRHRTQFDDSWAGEAFAQTGRDTFTRLSNRTLFGGGARLTALEDPGKAAVYLGLGAFYEREQLNAAVGATDAESKLWRGNLYLVLKAKLNEQVVVSTTTYYQPSFEDSGDYRLLEEASAKVKVLENVDLKLSIDYTFDARPAQTVKSADFRYKTGFDIRF